MKAKIIRVKRVSHVSEGPALRVVPRAAEHEAAETAVPTESEVAVQVGVLQGEVQALCKKSNSITNQVGRIMNMGDDEFDRNKSIGLYQRIAVLRASGIVLMAKLVENGVVGYDLAMATSITQQTKKMMEDLENRLFDGILFS